MREAVAALYRELGARGLNVGNAGNASARHGAGMLITPTGIHGDTVTPEGVVEMTLEGDVAGPGHPSSEWQMHAEIYRADPEAMVIVHTHSDHATALACLNLPLPAFHYAVAGFGGDDVRIAPYVTFGTPELAHAAAAAIAGRTACLLANHGMICHGRDAAGALLTAVRLETLARQYLIARAAGTPRLLTPAEMAAAHERYRTYGQQTRDA
ncbi:class II aldolase/adducin family protein [Limobrevibacterium gyesilva]|uniref:Class II aldolase/adducin family protein n=1 Tax=Limobrevibacterium gyesilva TaxID=2991712 RepID=A0AA42CDF0_9PROT|nr:class II aldolase/adducin family protein [Limobrevibacterium gyesilva]MCW3473749.1 class II aldolase/adducin family protein [Limobrevibacterium gyesilva]